MKKIDFIDIIYIILSFILGGLVGWIFYQHKIMAVIVGAISTLSLKWFHAYRARAYRAKIIDEFLAINRMLISELHAGKSVSMAYRGIYQRLEKDDFEYNNAMKKELKIWCIKMDAGMSIMEILKDFSETYNDDYITQFYTMMEVSLENGASLLDVIEMTDRVIKDQLQMEREISVLVSEKKLEQVVLSVSPLFLLLFLQTISYDFIEPLYTTIGGRLVMTIALVVFIVCFMWSKKMTEVIK